MNVISLYSGSRGNSLLIQSNKLNMLIDVGTSMKKINEYLLLSVGIDLYDISYIFITHVHTDHILSMKSIYNKYEKTKFICDRQIKSDLETHFKVEFDDSRFVFVDNVRLGKTLTIRPIPLKHDVHCLGYSIQDQEESVLFVSDNGMYPYQFMKLPHVDIPHTYYVIESNYDLYSQYLDEKRNELLKRRVLSTHGHSDNFNAIEKAILMLETSNNVACKGIMFHHLSEHCNSLEIASKSHQAYISTWGKKRLTKDIKIVYATQNEYVEM